MTLGLVDSQHSKQHEKKRTAVLFNSRLVKNSVCMVDSSHWISSTKVCAVVWLWKSLYPPCPLFGCGQLNEDQLLSLLGREQSFLAFIKRDKQLSWVVQSRFEAKVVEVLHDISVFRTLIQNIRTVIFKNVNWIATILEFTSHFAEFTYQPIANL